MTEPYDPTPERGQHARHARSGAQLSLTRMPRRWRITAIAGVVVVAGAIVLATSLSASGKQDTTDGSDVTVAHCGSTTVSGTTVGDALLSVTNTGWNTADYNIDVAFTSPDGATLFDTAATTVTALPQGQSATTDAVGAQPLPSGFTCSVTSVNRD